ncbi:ATP-binding protein [Microbacterium sp. P01]|uniref:ATP-binding protein n=1 Tax=Microbacterium sp. P01 TaxID=3366261 RepID=UPI003673312A
MVEWVPPRLPLRWTSTEQPPFVGRDENVATSESAWAGVRAGAGRALFVLGEPGVGKSRLVGELCRRWHSVGAVVVVGTVVPEFATPYEPFVGPLRALTPLARGALAATGGTSHADVLAELARHDDDGSTLVGQGRLFDSVVGVVRAAATVHPLVLVLEDMHWADEGSIRLLMRLIETTSDAAVLVITTARVTAPERSDALAHAIARLSRLEYVDRIDVAPLTAEDVEEYLSRRTGMSPQAAREPARILGELTGGNPFLLRETWQQVVSAAAERGPIVELPESVNDLLRERITALAPTAQRTLRHAAILGLDVDLAELIAVSECAPADTLGGVDAAIASGLLEPPRLVRESYRFPHAIARQAVLDQMSSTETAQLHARTAVALRDGVPNAPRLVQRLAHHFASARPLGYGDEAVEYLTRAAEHAHRSLAHEEAGRLFERAAGSCVDRVAADDLRLRAARAWVSTADFARARALLELVAEQGSPAQRRAAAIGFEEASWRPGLDGRRALALLTRASRDGMTFAEEVQLGSSTARALAFTGDMERARALSSQMVRRARDAESPAALTVALRYSVNLGMRAADVRGILADAVELRELSAVGSDEYNAGVNIRGMACYIVGDGAGMDQAESDLVDVAARSGSYWNYWVYSTRFGRSVIEGRLADAAVTAELVRRADGDLKSDRDDGVSALQSYILRRETRAVTRIAPLLTGAESTRGRWVPGLLSLYCELEMKQPARRVLGEALPLSVEHPAHSAEWPAWLAFMAEAACWLEDRDAAAAIRPAVDRHAGLNLLAGWFVAPLGAADRYVGELDSVSGTGDPDA